MNTSWSFISIFVGTFIGSFASELYVQWKQHNEMVEFDKMNAPCTYVAFDKTKGKIIKECNNILMYHD